MSRGDDPWQIELRHSIEIIVLSSLNLILSTVCIALIISNFIRLFSHKLLSWLISLFYVFALLAVLANIITYSMMVYWIVYQKDSDSISHK